MTKILVASDGSPSAERAVGFAAELARSLSADLLIVTVTASITDRDLEQFSRFEHATLTEVLDAEGDRILARGQAIAESKYQARAKICLAHGDPVSVVLARAQDDRVDIIVVGKRGRGALAGLLLGSVSQKLVTLASCAVIVVP